MLSMGVPMIVAGDEFMRTQGGNNNTYCHDNEINWFDWNQNTTARMPGNDSILVHADGKEKTIY